MRFQEAQCNQGGRSDLPGTFLDHLCSMSPQLQQPACLKPFQEMARLGTYTVFIWRCRFELELRSEAYEVTTNTTLFPFARYKSETHSECLAPAGERACVALSNSQCTSLGLPVYSPRTSGLLTPLCSWDSLECRGLFPGTWHFPGRSLSQCLAPTSGTKLMVNTHSCTWQTGFGANLALHKMLLLGLRQGSSHKDCREKYQ